jgi:hypothetical protein
VNGTFPFDELYSAWGQLMVFPTSKLSRFLACTLGTGLCLVALGGMFDYKH